MKENHPHFALIADKILLDSGFVSGQAIVVNGDTIEAIVPVADLPPQLPLQALAESMIVPGLIDLQVNGGGGYLLNNRPEVSTVDAMVKAHRKFGTTSILPTVISDTAINMQKCIQAVKAAMEQQAGILGIHLEGPFFSPKKRGVHKKSFLRQPNELDLKLLTSLSKGKTLVTLAPEQVTESFIEALVQRGAVVSAGHTNAKYETTLEAIASGLTGFTHLFNAMPAISGREPGAIGAALNSEKVFCGIIVDLIHVHPASIALAQKSLSAGHLFLVSDAMATIGAEDKTFELYGEIIHEASGRLVNNEGNLAGSAITLIDAVRNMVSHLNTPLDEAIRMASAYPADFIGLSNEVGRIRPGMKANLLQLDTQLNVMNTWLHGSDNSAAN